MSGAPAMRPMICVCHDCGNRDWCYFRENVWLCLPCIGDRKAGRIP